MRKAFNFYRSYYDVLVDIENPLDQLEYLKAILDRQFLGKQPELTGIAKIVYNGQRHSVDKSVEGYESKMGIKLTPPTEGPYQGPTEGGREGGTEGPTEGPTLGSPDGVAMTTEGGREGGTEGPSVQEKEQEKEEEKEEVEEFTESDALNYVSKLLNRKGVLI